METFNSIETVVNLSIKYQIGRLERSMLDAIPTFAGKNVVPFVSEFHDAGAETQTVIRQTAEFFFTAFNWQGCRVIGSHDLVMRELPSRHFKSYSITFFIDNPNMVSVHRIINILTDMLSLRYNPQKTPPKLVRDPILHSAVSQRVNPSPTNPSPTNPATIVDLTN